MREQGAKINMQLLFCGACCFTGDLTCIKKIILPPSGAHRRGGGKNWQMPFGEYYCVDKCLERAQRFINLEIPVLVRSLKSGNVELGEYLDGRLF